MHVIENREIQIRLNPIVQHVPYKSDNLFPVIDELNWRTKVLVLELEKRALFR